MTSAKSKAELRALRGAAQDRALDAKVREQIEELKLADRIYVFKPETRCRVCRVPDTASMINKMLANGQTYREILRVIAPLNRALDKGEQITYASIRHHSKTHFQLDKAAQLVYRNILERRAEEAKIDFIDGVQNAITPLAYLETVSTKGYRKLVSDEDNVSVELGMNATLKLHELLKEGEESADIADIMVKYNQLVEVIRDVVPEEYWIKIVQRLEDIETNSTSADVVEDPEDAAEEAEYEDEPYDPVETGVDRDEDELD